MTFADILHRQNGERPARQKPFMCYIVVGKVVEDGTDDAGLVIGKSGNANAGGLAQAGITPVARQ